MATVTDCILVTTTEVIQHELSLGREVFLMEDHAGLLALYSTRSCTVDQYKRAVSPDPNVTLNALIDHLERSMHTKIEASVMNVHMFIRFKAKKIYVFTQNAWHKYRTTEGEVVAEDYSPPTLEAYLAARNVGLDDLQFAELACKSDSKIPLALVNTETGFRISLFP